MTVVAMPVTIVCGSPALNVSTVVSRQGTPALARIRSMTCWAVSSAADRAESAADHAEHAEAVVGQAEAPAQTSVAAPAATNSRLDGSCERRLMLYEPLFAASLVERYSALNSSGNVAWVCARCCGRR